MPRRDSRSQRARTALSASLALLTALIALSALGLLPLLHELIHLGFTERAIVAVALIAPLGATAGMAMPLGLKRFVNLYPGAVAYAWGVNGVASVLASVLGITVAIHYGFIAATFLTAACYLFALLHAVAGKW